MAGPAPTASQLSVQLQQNRPGAFEVTGVANPADARDLILDREVYGAIVVDPPNTSVLTASAASPAVAQLLGRVATGLGEAQRVQVPVEDVRSMPDDDPNGAGLGAAALPLVLGGWIASWSESGSPAPSVPAGPHRPRRSPAPPRRPDRGRRRPSSKACAARLGFTVEAAQDSHSQPCIIDRDVHIKIGSLA